MTVTETVSKAMYMSLPRVTLFSDKLWVPATVLKNVFVNPVDTPAVACDPCGGLR